MPFTTEGYEVRRFRDILENIRSGLETSLGTPISSDPDSVVGIVNSIFSNEVSTVENNTQALVKNISIFTAEGRYLDELVRYIGITRNSAQPANGSLKVWRGGEGYIPSSVLFANNIGIEFTVAGGMLHTLDSCAEVLLDVGVVAENDVFTLTLNSIVFTYTALITDTATEVVDYFVSEIFNQLGITSENRSNQLYIVAEDEDLNDLSVELNEGFTLVEIASFFYCESILTEYLTVPENTVTVIKTNNPSLLRSTNPFSLADGSDEETDEELRARHQQSIQLGGNATVPAIVAKLLQVPNVTQAYIVENRTLVVDGSGRPAKSYETFVVGGDPNVIGQTIWDSKPAGVETTGSITSLVTDNIGVTQSVQWSRPEDIYIFVRVTYDLYNEETFPPTGEDTIAQAILDYGNSLDIGSDVIPTRFVGGVYQAVDGVGSILVEVGSSTEISDTSPASGYGTTSIPINVTQIPQFTLSRIIVQQSP